MGDKRTRITIQFANKQRLAEFDKRWQAKGYKYRSDYIADKLEIDRLSDTRGKYERESKER